jgi:endo-1,4-beta-xylanase
MRSSAIPNLSRRAFVQATGAAGIAAGIPLLFPQRLLGESATVTPAGGSEPSAAANSGPAERVGIGTLRSLAAKKGLLLGTAFSNSALENDPTYGEVLAREFNCLVAENSMKLDAIQQVRGKFDFGEADAMMAFAARHAMKVRAVPLVWHEALPEWAAHKTFPRQEALDILHEHIATVMRHFRGRICAWDVLNEGLNDKGPGLREEGPWFHSIGPDYVEKIYHWAHEADPEAVLFYNDFNMDGMSEKAERCYLWIKELLARGVPIHGIGLQYHVRVDQHPDPAEVTRNIRRFNDLGLSVHITELDVWLPTKVSTGQLQQQAAVYRGIFETALAARNCPAVMLWGFTDRYSWVPGTSGGTYDHALIFDRDYRAKPAYAAIAAALG